MVGKTFLMFLKEVYFAQCKSAFVIFQHDQSQQIEPPNTELEMLMIVGDANIVALSRFNKSRIFIFSAFGQKSDIDG